MTDPSASASVKGSPSIHTAKPIVTSGEIVEIIAVACGEVRAMPAFMRNDGRTVAKIAQPAPSQMKRGVAAKVKPFTAIWCSTQITADARVTAM